MKGFIKTTDPPTHRPTDHLPTKPPTDHHQNSQNRRPDLKHILHTLVLENSIIYFLLLLSKLLLSKE